MSLVSYWPLNESSGDAIDIRGGNDGTVNGATQGAGGILGNTAYSFDSSNNEYLKIGNPVLNSDGPLTIIAWTNINSLSTSNCVFVEQPSGGGDTRNFFRVDTSGKITFDQYNDDGAGFITSNDTISTNEWHQIAITVDSSQSHLYIDGVENNANSKEGYTGSVPDNSFIGYRFEQSSYPLDGKISDLRIYNHALTPSEVQYLYQVGQNAKQVSTKKTL
jgi:hypothetical protein